jgi:hypothetical protein
MAKLDDMLDELLLQIFMHGNEVDSNSRVWGGDAFIELVVQCVNTCESGGSAVITYWDWPGTESYSSYWASTPIYQIKETKREQWTAWK